MNIYSLKDGLILGLMAMTGVFVVLAIIGLILYSFELIFYKKEKKAAPESAKNIIVEEGIPKKVVAAIASSIFYYIKDKNKPMAIKITRHKKIKNKAYQKLKVERWKNG